MAEKKQGKRPDKTEKQGEGPDKKDLKGRLDAVNRELAEIEKQLKEDTKSVMFEGEDGTSDSKLVHMSEHAKEDMRSYYRRMVLRCMNCSGSFDHELVVDPIEHEIRCPACNESHILTLKPTSRLFMVHSKSVDVLDSEE
ncbi:MAG: hypothetical protein GF416_08460 [Candidatus Altiarchaeales archaeon]|nr:hypothetical protein [Candidatus Altiarchaeales archaeon]MBD3417147.1 hypothetical protein [Candidatus Altiarchaeales archaeon]